MRFVLFCHSLVSDWNHGNAHFVRGVAAELRARGHDVVVHEPLDGWSRANLVAEHGRDAVVAFEQRFPDLRSRTYDLSQLDVAALVEGADVVVVHEWNDPELVAAVGRRRTVDGFRLFFHDTHHRMATAPDEMRRYDLSGYDGVLAFGAVLRELYLERGMARDAWTWHEAADVRVFRPLPDVPCEGELVWVGNWGDGERTAELRDFLLGPVRRLRLRARVHGVRYPAEARTSLAHAGIEYAGWIANHDVPAAFAAHATTVHVPRGPYVRALPGIPTIRPFEAMACGIPLVSAPWDDTEGLFRQGVDHLVARDGAAATDCLAAVLDDEDLARSLRDEGLRTIHARHTCAHRVDELLAICTGLGLATTSPPGGAA